MLAELTSPNQDNSVEVGSFAATLSPHDPLPRWLVATKQKQIFSPESTVASLENFEKAVRLAPNDFRWWIELGRALEQSDRPEDAEKALRQAVLLAPAYTFPRWQLGNFYLRQERPDESFAELIKTAEKSTVYRDQVFSLAWDYFDNDTAKVEELANSTPESRASLAKFYASRSRPKDSLRIWNMLDDGQKAQNASAAKVIAKILIDKVLFNEAVEFARQSGSDPDARSETITNGDFENPIAVTEDSLFGWKINRTVGGVDTAADSTVKRKGTRSLKTTFRNFEKPMVYTIHQTVSLETQGSYRLNFWVRTENLKSGGPPFLEIADCRNEKVVKSSIPFPVGTSDWQEISVEFIVPEGCQGIVVRTTRVYCGEQCPLVGTFWYDDFNIVRQ
ncbi:MAG: carbohydrate binding domain-containing protein [Saprospiraceae bacterium]|nr:carbohydrate binding domain-containing protein [Pyrinomonadaceae bacterium]